MSDYEDKIKISFDTNADQTKQSVDGVAKAVNNTTDAVEQQEKAQVSLRQQLRNANMELQNTINKYGETSKEAIASAKAVANLKDQMEFAQQLSKSFNPDQKFKALTSASQLAGTGLQGVTSGMALFGDQSKDTQAQLLKVQAAMAFSDAISNLSNVADQWELLKTTIKANTVFTKANTATTWLATIAQKAFTGSVNTTSFGFKALKVAIASVGIGLLVTGVALLVNNFDSLKAILFKAVPQLENVGKSIMGIVNAVTDFLGFTSEAQRLQDKMLAKANKSIKDNEYLLDVNANKYDEYTKRKIQANINYNKKVDELNKDEELSEKEKNARVKAYREKANKEILQADIDRAKANEKSETKTIEKKEKSNKIVEKKEDEHAKAILSKEAELKKQLEDLEDKTEQQKLDRQKQRDAKEIELLGATGKQKQNLLLNLDKIYIEKQNELNAKIEAEEKQKQKDFLDKFKIEEEEKVEYEKTKFDAEIESIYEKEQARIDAEKEAALLSSEGEGGTPEEKKERELAINRFYQNENLKAEEDFSNAKKDLKQKENDALNGLGNQAVGLAKDIFAKNKNIQKGILVTESAVALGKVAKNTVEGVSKSISSSPLTVGMPWSGIIGAKGILDAATIVSSTNKALQSLGGGSVSGGGATAQAPQGVSAQPQVGVQASSENQIATSIAKSQIEQAPIKAYVVSSDVTTAQNLDAKIISENSFLV